MHEAALLSGLIVLEGHKNSDQASLTPETVGLQDAKVHHVPSWQERGLPVHTAGTE